MYQILHQDDFHSKTCLVLLFSVHLTQPGPCVAGRGLPSANSQQEDGVRGREGGKGRGERGWEAFLRSLRPKRAPQTAPLPGSLGTWNRLRARRKLFTDEEGCGDRMEDAAAVAAAEGAVLLWLPVPTRSAHRSRRWGSARAQPGNSVTTKPLFYSLAFFFPFLESGAWQQHEALSS